MSLEDAVSAAANSLSSSFAFADVYRPTCTTTFPVIFQLMAFTASAAERARWINADLLTVSIVRLTLVNVCCKTPAKQVNNPFTKIVIAM